MATDSVEPRWGQFPGEPERSYSSYFREQRAGPPIDETPSTRITQHAFTRHAGERTKTVSIFDPAQLTATFKHNVALDWHLVRLTLDTYGPILDQGDTSDWSFGRNPNLLSPSVDSEPGFYPWFLRLIAAPVAHACNAVCTVLEDKGAGIHIPGFIRADIVIKTSTCGGAADLIQRRYQPATKTYLRTPCSLYEFKCDNVLRVADTSTLARLVELAHTTTGYDFRADKSAQYSSHEGKLYNMICQIIDELIQGHTGHVVVATQTKYVLIRLSDTLQLETSEIFDVRGSPTQLDDMVTLVLFCTLAALGQVNTYRVPVQVQRVCIPQFPAWVFRPYQGVFWDGAQQEQTEFCKPRKLSLLPLSWLRLEGEVVSSANDVSVARGRLLLFFLAACVVAKIAHGSAATHRLDREFLAYSTLHTWQGVAIPRIFGIYTSADARG
ncbi:hypothetical protein B0H15DRAFT_249338 [Mycena belliarum]|uniref:Uncharacterized protein n=1 Tax=Mycena belliarum TaxID=1033014 RepID=A0AAD6XVM0_9AGAR|nr:hypothetical protein B0H15DRAFT_249338 [Mycena belliae]